jgi:hypothetical protein
MDTGEAQRRFEKGARRAIRGSFLTVMLCLAAGHYYFWAVHLDILKAERNHYFVPAKGQFVVLRSTP